MFISKMKRPEILGKAEKLLLAMINKIQFVDYSINKASICEKA